MFPCFWFIWGDRINTFHVEQLKMISEFVANENLKKEYLKVKDHSVSGETFQLLHHKELDMLETYPQPSLDQLPQYYKSENYI